ncbi:MAG: peptidoglycan-binding protein [Clostridia bacterium]|nr:peptidoglycan-binding protein [Clostridia bacterium]
MSTKVDPNKVDELSSEYKRLSRIIEDGERGINREISRLINDTEAQYDEYYVRANTREIEFLLEDIRLLAEAITGRLNAKSYALKQAANQYRSDEEKAKRVFKVKSNLSLAKEGSLLALPPGVTPLKNNPSINPKVYNEEVKKLQQKLKDLGYDIEADGYFGQKTLAAVNAYKNKYGLGNSGKLAGVVGNQTWLYLFGRLTGELKFDPKKYSAQVKMAQIRLKDQGYDVDVTGFFDEKTLKAVNEFKEKNNLGNTGKWKGVIGPQTWDVLFGLASITRDNILNKLPGTGSLPGKTIHAAAISSYYMDIDNAIENIRKSYGKKGNSTEFTDTLYIQMYLWVLGYDLGSSGPAGIGVDGIFSKKTKEAVDKVIPGDITNLKKAREILKEKVASTLKKRALEWVDINNKSGSLLDKDKYPLVDPMFYVFFQKQHQKDIDPIFSGRLAAFAKSNKIVVFVGSGYRSYQEQVRSYIKSGGYKYKNGNWVGGDGSAAKPGNSWHNFGEAIDISWQGEPSSIFFKGLYGHREATKEQKELTKFGIFKPLTSGNGMRKKSQLENWHIQPIETEGIKVNKRKSFYDAYKSIKPIPMSDVPKTKGQNPKTEDKSNSSNSKANNDNKSGYRTISDFKTKYDDVIKKKAKELNVDSNSLAAVIFTESSGAGFYKNGSMKIRFEVHIFFALCWKHS